MQESDLTDRVSKKAFRDLFHSDYPQQARYTTAMKFNKKVKQYCAFHKIGLTELQVNGVLSFEFTPAVDDSEPPF